jgi:hypothetical protein
MTAVTWVAVGLEREKAIAWMEREEVISSLFKRGN